MRRPKRRQCDIVNRSALRARRCARIACGPPRRVGGARHRRQQCVDLGVTVWRQAPRSTRAGVAGEIELALSDAILHETLRVLHDKFHTNRERVEEIERFLSAISTRVYPTERIDAVAADRGDNRVLECAVKAGSRVIVSGDQHLLRLGRFNDNEVFAEQSTGPMCRVRSTDATAD